MKRIKYTFYFLLFSIISGGVNAEINNENSKNVIYQGKEYVKLKIDMANYREIFKSSSPTDEGLTSDFNKIQAKEIYSFRSLAGIKESDIPQSIKDELLFDEGYSNWNSVNSTQLNTKLNIALDVQMAMEEGDEKILGICSKVWKKKSKTISQIITPKQNEVFDINNGGLSGSLNINLNSQGSLNLDVHYQTKERKCVGIPYAVKYDYTRVRAYSNLDGSGIGISANLAYQYSKKAFDKDVKITLFDFTKSWWVWFFRIELNAEVFASYNVSLDAKIATSFEIEQPMTGHVNIDWHCTNDGCRKDINDIAYDFTSQTERNFEVIADITVRPYLELAVSAEANLYWGLIDVAKVQVGVVGSIPLRYYGYYGNMCGDANGDGTNETVSASVIDVAAEMYMYYKFALFNYVEKRPIEINIHDWDKVESADVLLSCSSWILEKLGACNNIHLYKKSLLFKDLIGGGSSIFEPIIITPNSITPGDALVGFSARSCHPFTDKLKMEIDWGDGITELKDVKTTGDIFSHKFNNLGATTIMARIKSDEVGRNYRSNWTDRTVMVAQKQLPVVSVSATYSTVNNALFFNWIKPTSGNPHHYEIYETIIPKIGNKIFKPKYNLTGNATSKYVSTCDAKLSDRIVFSIAACDAYDNCSTRKSAEYTVNTRPTCANF